MGGYLESNTFGGIKFQTDYNDNVNIFGYLRLGMIRFTIIIGVNYLSKNFQRLEYFFEYFPLRIKFDLIHKK